MKKNTEDFWSGVLFIAIAIAVTTQLSSIKITNIAMTSRMIPDICAILLYAFGIIQIIKWVVFRNKGIESSSEKSNTPKEKREKYLIIPIVRVTICAILFAVFIFLLKPIGFIIAGTFYLFSTFLVLVPQGYKNKVVYIVSILFPIAVYFLFTKAFNIILPTGTLW